MNHQCDIDIFTTRGENPEHDRYMPPNFLGGHRELNKHRLPGRLREHGPQ